MMTEFFSMGGYAAYVWPVYGLAAVVVAGIVWQSVADYRAQLKLASDLEARGGGRVRRAAKAPQQDAL